MNFDILNQVEKTFDEISLFYTYFNNHPVEGVSLLYDDHDTTRDLKTKLDSSKHLQSAEKKESKIIFLGIRKVTYEHRAFSEQDVVNWLYNSRIEKLYEHKNQFEQSLSGLDKQDRTIRLESLREKLNRLLTELTGFENKTIDDFPELKNDSTSDWVVIIERIDDFIPYLINVIKEYNEIVCRYLAPENLESPSLKSGKKKSILVTPAPEKQTGLSRKETLLLMYYLRKMNIIWKSIDNTTLAKCFGVLTGFSENSLRQDLSNEIEEMATKNNYNSLTAQLEKLLSTLRTDSEKL